MSSEQEQDTTHFGYQQVPVAEKQQRVAEVFRSVAQRYDIMNDVMSMGSHRLIKRFTIELSALRKGHKVLDLAGGTGDLAMKFAPIVGEQGQVILADINDAMLQVGRDRVIDKGLANIIDFALVNAETLPFADNTFDCVCIAYGLRNVTDKDKALASMTRVLKPGGRVVVLEFSKPRNPILGRAYDVYSNLWPIAGKMITGDSDSYRYLVESIRMHPDQETLLGMMENAGLINCRFHDVMNGICAIHIGFKPDLDFTAPAEA
ncbi:MAG: bifunctional demethylmenaquinone methyltransferase/2-methoxy-6-polyprenyl-1,4-benzoquinol methylase UbiE [Proteobacteria bacterium]|jgi:demethylmenaquinone methyltransferase/2-methoxy-6-polyprenyl-1,4-benzoquinol methylase|nr:bifunctional demethylmenaquinone methyltransferase/2-methoxy-6-polyprenyl-1,4-benzoquinol methylase UbiE [Pseudomonadota bacterium]MDA0926531.1 bifunctional demethylmenaquinone methyltransferase/2-methoxy-6-polyprenyl-1,4-benzoquinol methylase UbiE [Pseudomonadota bacterium]